MRQLKRNECAILPLVLKGKWYDMIASGEKKEEYRDAKIFWELTNLRKSTLSLRRIASRCAYIVGAATR